MPANCERLTVDLRETVDARRIAPPITGRPYQEGSTGRDDRMFVEGVLWIVRRDAPRRAPPDAFGEWNGVSRRSVP